MANDLVSRVAEPARGEEPWVALDRQLRSIAARRAALDHEELALIRNAVRIQIWRPLGMASMREYLEDRMGYGPQVAAERLRVTDALEGLPMIEDALARNELHYSAVRELTRIATCKTEAAWLAACRGMNLRQIEELVAEREPGDAPTDRPKPDLRPQVKRLTLRPAAIALMRQVRHALANERGEPIDDSELIEELCRSWLGGTESVEGEPANDESTNDEPANDEATNDEPANDGPPNNEAMNGEPLNGELRAGRAAVSLRRGSRPPVQISITTCDACKQARQHAAGRTIAITDAEYQTAACDAVMIGSLDGAPCRATSTIPPATRRMVMQRDNFRCTVPWCRAAANIDVHHLDRLADGGGHEPENLTCLCFGHHAAHHRGELLIEGRAPNLTFRRTLDVPANEDRPVPHVGDLRESLVETPVPARSAVHRDALLALTTLGFRKHEAERALCASQAQIRPDEGLESLVRAALRELR